MPRHLMIKRESVSRADTYNDRTTGNDQFQPTGSRCTQDSWHSSLSTTDLHSFEVTSSFATTTSHNDFYESESIQNKRYDEQCDTELKSKPNSSPFKITQSLSLTSKHKDSSMIRQKDTGSPLQQPNWPEEANCFSNNHSELHPWRPEATGRNSYSILGLKKNLLQRSEGTRAIRNVTEKSPRKHIHAINNENVDSPRDMSISDALSRHVHYKVTSENDLDSCDSRKQDFSRTPTKTANRNFNTTTRKISSHEGVLTPRKVSSLNILPDSECLPEVQTTTSRKQICSSMCYSGSKITKTIEKPPDRGPTHFEGLDNERTYTHDTLKMDFVGNSEIGNEDDYSFSLRNSDTLTERQTYPLHSSTSKESSGNYADQRPRKYDDGMVSDNWLRYFHNNKENIPPENRFDKQQENKTVDTEQETNIKDEVPVIYKEHSIIKSITEKPQRDSSIRSTYSPTNRESYTRAHPQSFDNLMEIDENETGAITTDEEEEGVEEEEDNDEHAQTDDVKADESEDESEDESAVNGQKVSMGDETPGGETPTPTTRLPMSTTTTSPSSPKALTTESSIVHQHDQSSDEHLHRRQPSPIESNNLEGSQAAPDNITADSGIVSDISGAASGSPDTPSAFVPSHRSHKRTHGQAFGTPATHQVLPGVQIPARQHTPWKFPRARSRTSPIVMPSPVDASTPDSRHWRPWDKRQESREDSSIQNSKSSPTPSGNNSTSDRSQESIIRQNGDLVSTTTEGRGTNQRLPRLFGEGVRAPPHHLRHLIPALPMQAVVCPKLERMRHPTFPVNIESNSQPLDLSRKDSLSVRQTPPAPPPPPTIPLISPLLRYQAPSLSLQQCEQILLHRSTVGLNQNYIPYHHLLPKLPEHIPLVSPQLASAMPLIPTPSHSGMFDHSMQGLTNNHSPPNRVSSSVNSTLNGRHHSGVVCNSHGSCQPKDSLRTHEDKTAFLSTDQRKKSRDRTKRSDLKTTDDKAKAPSEQTKEVPLALPPPGARKTCEFIKSQTKKKASVEKTNGKRKRENPLPFGNEEIVTLAVVFYESTERARFCDLNFEFTSPEIPADRAGQEELRFALLKLFEDSNLPKVPTPLMSNVNSLCQYPKMQHLFHLARTGCDLETLKFSKSGQAFVNPKLLELGEKQLNAELDKMSYAGADGYLHCLVLRGVDDGAVCDHIAAEVGKMRRHARNHHPERKWVCCFCRVQMSDLTDMDRHISTHTEKKPFKCSECPQEFAQRVTLTTHMKNQHNKLAEKHDPRRSLTCRAHGLVFEAHQREACLEHIQKLHSNDMYQDRLRRNLWPINPNPTEKNSSAASSSSTTSGDFSDTENHV